MPDRTDHESAAPGDGHGNSEMEQSEMEQEIRQFRHDLAPSGTEGLSILREQLPGRMELQLEHPSARIGDARPVDLLPPSSRQ